jgi:membrane-bound lytic murein transglycosylase A
MRARWRALGALLLAGSIASISGGLRGAAAEVLTFADSQYQPVAWADLDGWASDDHRAAFAAFLTSCRAKSARQRPASSTIATIAAALRDICLRAQAAAPLDEAGARRFFEQNFRPLRIARLGQTDGFLTGYYEPIIDGSRVPTAEFTAPLYRRPPNLVASGARSLGGAIPSKGVVVGRRVGRRFIVPYYTRGEIEDGALDGWHLEICWVRSQLDVLFAQIQGSARIRLDDGSVLRVNYDSYNGWPYTSIGRVLVDRGLMTKDEVSMQGIRAWMEANPDQAKDVRRQNQSYVFFRVMKLGDKDEPIGAQGVPLMPGRSIAVDRALHAYGTPFFIEANLPLASAKASTPFRRLMIAQDTGSAIVGIARADIYFGAGADAARVAGRIKHPGRFVMLVPRTLDPVAAAGAMPLPPQRPNATSLAGSPFSPQP